MTPSEEKGLLSQLCIREDSIQHVKRGMIP